MAAAGTLVALLFFKTGLDLFFHLRERRSASGETRP